MTDEERRAGWKLIGTLIALYDEADSDERRAAIVEAMGLLTRPMLEVGMPNDKD